jgi:molybdopterin-guanine dinucleotide biosynthesis protein B
LKKWFSRGLVMSEKKPVVAVIGYKNSGKTTVLEEIVQNLTKNGYNVATAKHISSKGFSMDIKGKDTWKHSAAGANPVIIVSDKETVILTKKGYSKFSLHWLFTLTSRVDVVVLEGFSKAILKDEQVGKIFCVRNWKEYEFFSKVKGNVLAFCSQQNLGRKIIRIKEDFLILHKRVLKFISSELSIERILKGLPSIDCKKCGYSTCKEMAIAVHRNEAKVEDCVILKLKKNMNTRIILNDKEIPIQPFVSEIISNSILGMVSSLKGVNVKGNEKIDLKIFEN